MVRLGVQVAPKNSMNEHDPRPWNGPPKEIRAEQFQKRMLLQVRDLHLLVKAYAKACSRKGIAQRQILQRGMSLIEPAYSVKRLPQHGAAAGPEGDGAFLAVGWTSGRIELYWAGTKEKLITLEGHQGAVRRIVFTAGSRLMLSSGQDGTIRVWGAVP